MVAVPRSCYNISKKGKGGGPHVQAPRWKAGEVRLLLGSAEVGDRHDRKERGTSAGRGGAPLLQGSHPCASAAGPRARRGVCGFSPLHRVLHGPPLERPEDRRGPPGSARRG